MAPLANARARLAQVQASYAKGETEQAYAEALAAYLEGFELAENALDAIDHPLRLQIEKDMMALRSAVKAGEPAAQVGQQVEELQGLLSTAEERLGARRLDGMGALISALLILLREGLEAILVVAALAAFLVKTGQREGLRYLHAGWAGALLLGGLTWWISEHLFSIGGAQRELTEGIGALVAAAVMFFVGFWMHDRSQAAQWQRYVQGSVRKVLTTGRLWGLAGLSFIAVYRECFETVLFYQALWTQVDEGGRSFALAGIGIAAASLAVLAWLITRYSVRLPLRQFFAATGVFLFVLAIIFAGKGVVALQEAGLLPPLAISGPRIELLGIYPNLLSLGLQTILIVLAILTTRRAARTVETE
jgi:high-affinity iron transporter